MILLEITFADVGSVFATLAGIATAFIALSKNITTKLNKTDKEQSEKIDKLTKTVEKLSNDFSNFSEGYSIQTNINSQLINLANLRLKTFKTTNKNCKHILFIQKLIYTVVNEHSNFVESIFKYKLYKQDLNGNEALLTELVNISFSKSKQYFLQKFAPFVDKKELEIIVDDFKRTYGNLDTKIAQIIEGKLNGQTEKFFIEYIITNFDEILSKGERFLFSYVAKK